VAQGQSPAAAAKTALRDQVVTSRNRRTLAERAELSRALAEHLMATPDCCSTRWPGRASG
jgi:5-formyltetrahydrofolate cyclo-ligase